MVSFNTDGKFTIKQGQGITQGIQEELLLSDTECKQLGSIWDDIINEIKSEDNVKVYNNRNEKPNESNNFKIYENAVIEFSSTSWSKIVSWVNQKLGKDIGVKSSITESKILVDSVGDEISSDFGTKINQVKVAILQNIDSVELENEDKNKIKDFLRQFSVDKVQSEAKNDSTFLSGVAIELISQAVMSPSKAIVIVSQLINSDTIFEDIEINEPSASPSIQGKKISEVANAILNNTPEKIQNIYNQAQERLGQYLASNPNREFNSPYDSNKKIKASELLQYINNIKYDSSDYGAAQAYDFTPDDRINERNGILINTNKFCSNPYLSEADALKILIHESLHCAFSKEHFAFNNQQEEMYCERQAIQLTSSIVNASGSEITDIQSSYGITYSEFNTMSDSELTSFLENNFINKGYEHRPKNTNGDVNINGYEVKQGDAVYLNGKQIGSIGTVNGKMTRESCIMDQLNPNNINMMIPNGAGRVVFTDSQPEEALPLEIKRGGNKIFTAVI